MFENQVYEDERNAAARASPAFPAPIITISYVSSIPISELTPISTPFSERISSDCGSNGIGTAALEEEGTAEVVAYSLSVIRCDS